MKSEDGEQPDPEDGQEESCWDEVATEVPQCFGVEIDVVVASRVHPCEDFEVPKEMSCDIAEESDACDRHNPLEPDGGGEEATEPLAPAASFVHGRSLFRRQFVIPRIEFVESRDAIWTLSLSWGVQAY